jgi:hypothetical protein
VVRISLLFFGGEVRQRRMKKVGKKNADRGVIEECKIGWVEDKIDC